MKQSRLASYIEIRQKTYHIIERTFFHAVQVGFSKSLTAKGLNTLYQIYTATSQGNPSITELATDAGMPINTYSKRIQALIQAGYIQSVQDDMDHRVHHLKLTESGMVQLNAYIDLVETLLKRLREEFGNLGLLRYVRALIESANTVTSPKLSKWALSARKYRSLATEALNRFYVGISKAEHTVLETYFEIFTLKEARVLLEIYVQSGMGRVTLKDLEDALKIPKPTLSRIVNKWTPTFIHKKTDKDDHRVVYLSVKEVHKEGFEKWIDTRIEVYEKLKKVHSPKDFERLIQSFKVFETLLLEKINAAEAY